MAVLDYQSHEERRTNGTLKGKLLVATLVGLGGGVASLSLAAIAATASIVFPLSLVGGPAAAWVVRTGMRYRMSEAELAPLMFAAGTVQYSCYGLLFIPRSRWKWLAVVVILSLHLACFVYVYITLLSIDET